MNLKTERSLWTHFFIFSAIVRSLFEILDMIWPLDIQYALYVIKNFKRHTQTLSDVQKYKQRYNIQEKQILL